MKKRIISLLLALVLTLTSFVQMVLAEGISINQEGPTLEVSFSEVEEEKFFILLSNGEASSFFPVKSNKEIIPLFGGESLEYSLSVLSVIEGRTFRRFFNKQLSLNGYDPYDIYLSSSQPVLWDKDDKSSSLAEEITKGLDSDKEKVEKIYDYIIKNISYDFEKIEDLNIFYVPNNEYTLTSGKGICYDYSVLFASMLRSVGIPAKLVKGYTEAIDVYHAWNEVYINGEWKTIDATFGAAYKEKSQNFEMYRDKSEYKAEKIY